MISIHSRNGEIYIRDGYAVGIPHMPRVCPRCHTDHRWFINRFGESLCGSCDAEVVTLKGGEQNGKSERSRYGYGM